jgi:hypothetical protein
MQFKCLHEPLGRLGLMASIAASILATAASCSDRQGSGADDGTGGHAATNTTAASTTSGCSSVGGAGGSTPDAGTATYQVRRINVMGNP